MSLSDSTEVYGSNRKIVVVDDDEAVLGAIMAVLEERSMPCIGFSNPEWALDYVLQNRPQCLIVDVTMPLLSGLEFCERVHGHLGLNAPPTIFLSASHDEELISKAYAAGAVDFLVKPVLIGELMGKLRKVVKSMGAQKKAEKKLQRLGDYEVIDILARGGMSVIYEARHRDFEKTLAIKVLHTDQCDQDSLLRFRREIQLLASLEHPHLARFIESGRHKDVFFFVMELVEGETLNEHIDLYGPMDWQQAYEVSHQVAQAVQHLHQKQVLHRDIKPANILLEASRGAVLVDLGLAKHFRDLQLTQSDVMIGTPLYIAPEVFEQNLCDERSDLFSLGMVTLQMLMGRRPLLETNLYEIFSLIADKQVPKAEHLDDVPDFFAHAIDRLLEVRSGDRFQSASQYLAVLDDGYRNYQRDSKV